MLIKINFQSIFLQVSNLLILIKQSNASSNLFSLNKYEAYGK